MLLLIGRMNNSSSPDYQKGGVCFLLTFLLFSSAYFYLNWRTKIGAFGTRTYHLMYDIIVLLILVVSGVVLGILGAVFTKRGFEGNL